MSQIKIAVLVSGGGTNLQALINASHRGELPSGQLALVISNRESAYALTRAAKAGIPTETVLRRDFADGQAFEARILELLEQNGIQMIVLAGFMTILSKTFTDRYPNRILNVHPSLIPAFCGEGFYGLRVQKAVLDYGVRVTGATVHFVNEIPDGGQIILQKAVNIRPDDTPETLQKRVMRLAEWKILPKAVELVARDLSEHSLESSLI